MWDAIPKELSTTFLNTLLQEIVDNFTNGTIKVTT